MKIEFLFLAKIFYAIHATHFPLALAYQWKENNIKRREKKRKRSANKWNEYQTNVKSVRNLYTQYECERVNRIDAKYKLNVKREKQSENRSHSQVDSLEDEMHKQLFLFFLIRSERFRLASRNLKEATWRMRMSSTSKRDEYEKHKL